MSIESLKTMFLFRHCDDNDDDNDPCCNAKGYERITHWQEVFDSRLSKKSNLYLYSANANYNDDVSNLCRPNIDITSKTICAHSQRHAITSNYFATLSSIPVKLKIDYCTGNYDPLVTDIKDQSIDHEQNMVVWKHSELIKIINSFTSKTVPDWPADAHDVYNVVFKLSFENNDLKNGQFSYNCYNYENQTFSCPNEVQTWLKDFPLFS